MNSTKTDFAQNQDKSKFFYGWIIVAVATLALLVSNGLSIGGIPVFYKHVQIDLVNLGAVAPERIQSVYGLAPALTFLLAGFLAPLAGFLLQKLQARTMMLIGCAILGLGLLLYSQANAPVIVYLAHALLGTSLGFVGVLVSTVLVSNWFRRRRGLALGIVLTGTSFGGVLIPQIATPLIQSYGWRTAMILVSLIIWIILLPAIIFLVKNLPADIGLNPDGEKSESSQPSAVGGQPEKNETEARASARAENLAEGENSPQISAVEHSLENNGQRTTDDGQAGGMTLTEALATPIFWIFTFCAALIFYAIFVVSQQLNLYLQGAKIGFTPAQASFVQSLLFALSVIGKFLFGWLSDYFPATRVMLLSATTMFLSTLAFLYFNEQTVYLFAILFGLNYGGTFVLLQLLVADYFGLREYGKILGAVTVIETIGGAAGTFITAKIADADGGDYTRGFYGMIIVTGLALGLVLLLNLMFEKGKKRE